MECLPVSIYAIDFRPDRVTVAGDTVAYTADRTEMKPMGFVSKIIPIPTLKAAIFSRGVYGIVVMAAARLLHAPLLTDVDSTAEALPGILAECSDTFAAAAGIADWRSVALLEAVLIGWSEQENRPRIAAFSSAEGYKIQRPVANFGVYPFPPFPPQYAPKIADAPTDADLVATVEAGGRAFVDNAAVKAPIGGEVIAVSIDRAGISTRTLKRYADYDRLRTAAAAVTERIKRGDLKYDMAAGLFSLAECYDSQTGKPKVADAPATVTPMPERPKVPRQQRRRAEREARKAARAA